MPDDPNSEEAAMTAPAPELVERPETDDYDLLTYGEVAARMSELLASESGALAALQTSATFMKRFGLPPRPRT
jgi:hypothetical protein